MRVFSGVVTITAPMVPPEHDHERGDLSDVGQLAALDQQTAQNAASGQQQPSESC